MKKATKKHTIIAAIIMLLTAALLVYRYYIPNIDMKQKKHFTPANVDYTYDDSVTKAQLEDYSARQGWQLTLVNSDTPISNDCNVILTALDNGQAVDCRIYSQLQQMFDDARSQGIYPTITSSFRTAKDQQDILDSKYEDYKAQGLQRQKSQSLCRRVGGIARHKRARVRSLRRYRQRRQQRDK